MRRFQYLLVLVLLVVPLVQLSAAAGGEVAAAEGEVITIEWAGRDDAGEPVHEDNYVGQRLAERFPDVQFIINHADIEPKEKLLVMAASGELPEFGFIAKIHALAFDFYSDGITRSIPWDMVRERAPNLTRFLDEDPIGWITRQVPDKEEFFALASLKKYKGGLGNVPTLRYDWLERIGMEPPNAKDVEPEDPGRWFWAPYQYEYDDVVKILTAFRDQDLDGNGKDDTIPLLLSQKPSDFLSWTGMFGLTYYMDNVEVDGQITFNVITEDWKDFLKMMRSWYEEGFINRDFATMTGQKSTDIKMMANFGLYSDAWPKMFKADLPGRWQTVTQANFPHQKLIVVDPRVIDLVRTPHVAADYHLKLQPGTNVAIINGLAHVIVTEGLANDAFANERCDPEEYADWKAFVGQDKYSPKNVQIMTGVPADTIRQAARLYARGPNSAIYFGLGVTEHSQGSTMVIGMANLAMATGNIGREGVGVSPLRGQNNVQGSCDMGSFPHELPGYRHISDSATRELFEKDWGVSLEPEPGLRIPNMFDAALDGSFRGMYIQGEDFVQSDPNTQHIEGAMRAMECVVVQDLFLNETAKFAHVFFPGSTFLEKDGTFTNAERRIQLVRKVMPPVAGLADWEITMALSRALGYEMNYDHPSEIMDEIARLTPTFQGVSFEKIDKLGSIQWPCNQKNPEGTPTMHIGEFVRGKGKFVITEYVETDERSSRKFPLLLTTGRTLSQYNVGAQTRRTPNIEWHDQDILEIHPHDAEQRGIADGGQVSIASRAGDTVLTARVTERMQPGVVYTTFHHPLCGTNVVTTENSDWATNCPEYKVTAVQVAPVTELSRWQGEYREFSDRQEALLNDRETVDT